MTDTRSPFRSYWTAYGGLGAILTSVYFWAAVALTLATYPWWKGNDWWTHVIEITPSMLGFTLGGYVMLLAVGSEKFMELMARAGGKADSALIGVCAGFVHFIMIQFTALILALLFLATQESFWSTPAANGADCLAVLRIGQGGVAVLAFFYSLTTGIAATLRIYGLANLYVAMIHHELEEKSRPPRGD